MQRPTTIWRIAPVAWPVIALSITAEAASNGLRAYDLGTHLKQFTFAVAGTSVSIMGAVFVAASIAMSIAQSVSASKALSPDPATPRRQRITARLALVLFLAVSVTAMISHILEAQRAKGGDEATQRGDYDRALASHDDLTARIAALSRFGPAGKALPRPASVVEAQIGRLAAVRMSKRRWRVSKQCRSVSKQRTAEACAPIVALFPELAANTELAALSTKLDAAKERLHGLKRPSAAALSETAVSGVWPWLMGFAIVFLATFGGVIFTVAETVTLANSEETDVEAGTVSPETVAAMVSLLETVAPAPRETVRETVAGTVSRPSPAPTRRAKPLPASRSDGNGSGGQMTKLEAEQWLTTHLAMGYSLPAQGDLVARFSRPKGTVSKWCSDWEQRGIISRASVGRCKQLVAG